MSNILLILCLTPILTIGQNHYDICDKNEPLEQNWESKKSLFIPTDIDNYTLLFESMSLTEERNRRKIATEYYDISSDNGYSKKWLVEKGFFGVKQSKAIKRFKKLFPRKYYIVDTDSLNKYPTEQ
ncbi:MAG: hypothetical protein P8Q14_05875, partial [Vicingaceae bacterium]|nr:hypothetical protein [Vicingaceae bacterium]